jgi:HD-GYP domain-containing protein (c-di-GMP phosphodiesterase class II)
VARGDSAGSQPADELLRVLDSVEPGLAEHLRRVGRLAPAVGVRLGLTAEELDELALAAELHDIGKIAIPEAVLSKAEPLDEEERAVIRRHTVLGERILSAPPTLAPVAGVVRASHERWDGEGYPDGKSGEEIPLGARIIFVCDSFHAMTSERPYRRAMSRHRAVMEVRRCTGSHFDPSVVEAFCEVLADPASAAT